jgi:hypothetical protein
MLTPPAFYRHLQAGANLALSRGGPAAQRREPMKWMGIYLLGYILLLAAGLLALWKTGVLATIPPFWLGVGLLASVGIGIMVAVAHSGKKETIEVNRG